MADPKYEKLLEELRKYGDDVHIDFYDFDNDDDISPVPTEEEEDE